MLGRTNNTCVIKAVKTHVREIYSEKAVITAFNKYKKKIVNTIKEKRTEGASK
jgi:hypothetical protein